MVATQILNQESITQNRLAIDINDPGNNVGGTRQSGPEPIPVNIGNTQGAF